MITRRQLGPLTVGGLVSVLSACSSSDSALSRTQGQAVIEEFAVAERRPFPRLTGNTLQNGYIDSADFAGQVIVVNVWGSWCGPCRAEAPALRRASSEMEVESVQFIGIDVKDDDASAIAFEREFGIDYPSITTQDSDKAMLAIGSTVPLSAVPATLIVDKASRVSARIIGPSTYITLTELIGSVLGEADRP